MLKTFESGILNLNSKTTYFSIMCLNYDKNDKKIYHFNSLFQDIRFEGVC